MHKLLCLTMLFAWLSPVAYTQYNASGKITDGKTGEPLQGVNIYSVSFRQTVQSDEKGNFVMTVPSPDSLTISYTGYETMRLDAAVGMNIQLLPALINLDQVIVSGSREVQKRKEVPAAIHLVSEKMISETHATRIDMLLNKMPGVFMVDLGNEQHSMSVRQPMGYNNLYLYLEDGIPIRAMGDFNHNALIEVNQASVERIEVIKGPASSLYGSEAVGGAVNFVTTAPPTATAGKLQLESGSRGYRRADFSIGNSFKKWGVVAAGYLARQNQPVEEHNDFYKTALTLRTDHHFNENTSLITTADYIRYKTDQKGGLDSAHFYRKDYSSLYRFTYRKVEAFRLKSTLTRAWNRQSKTTATVFFRNSAIEQNPFYYITNIAGTPLRAKGQINEDAFKSLGTVIQHVQDIHLLSTKWITGVSIDISPATYNARFININRDEYGMYASYSKTDSLLTRYDVNLLNSAFYTQLAISPSEKIKITMAARYDRLDYRFDNHLQPGAYTGAPDTKDQFSSFTPKVGATYNPTATNGIYVNFSTGFAPPNINDLYSGVQVPELKPSTYTNYETGGWLAFAGNRGFADFSLYQMNGKNEIVNVRLPDGTYRNQNAGATRHRGVEASVKYTTETMLTFRMSGVLAEHKYVRYIQQGKNYSGNRMAQAPYYILNSEITIKPRFLTRSRLALEYQGMGNYFTDAMNTDKYKGFHILNARLGYAFKSFECWMNCLNLTNAVYATVVEKSQYGTSYRPGRLRSFHVGVAYHFRSSLKKQDAE